MARVLTHHGYVPYYRELHMTTQLQHIQRGSGLLPHTISLTVPEAPADYLGARFVQALDSETEVGACSYSTLALLTDEPAARRTGYIWWLHVSEAYRRRGIARALMAAAVDQLVAQVCTACWLTTAADNWAAQSFYYRLGFDVVDGSVSFRKTR